LSAEGGLAIEQFVVLEHVEAWPFAMPKASVRNGFWRGLRTSEIAVIQIRVSSGYRLPSWTRATPWESEKAGGFQRTDSFVKSREC